MVRRLPLIAVALAVLGAAWMLYDATWSFDGDAIERGAVDADDPFFDGVGQDWEETWDQAPRLVGAPGARATGPDGGSSGPPGAQGTARAVPGAAPVDGATVGFGGVVKATGGNAVEGVQVLVTKGGTAQQAVTDEHGRFALRIPAGRYGIELRGEGVGALRFPDYVVDGATGLEVEFRLKPTHRLTIAVNRNGRGVEQAEVVLVTRGGGGGETAVTDAGGVAVFEALIAGPYDLTITLAEAEQIRRRLDVSRDEEVKIDVPPGVLLHGSVEAADGGGAVSQARVEASVRLASGVWITVSTETGPDGRYELEVPKGAVGRFTATADGYAPWPDRRQIRSVLRAVAGIAQGKSVEHHVQLTQGLVLTGQAKDADGKGVAGLKLAVSPRRGPSMEALTDDDGNYTIDSLRADRYDAVVLSDGWFPDHALSFSIPSSLQPGEAFTFDLVVHPTIAVRGEVVHEGGKPAAGARVWIAGGGRVLRAAHDAGRDLETFTDASGFWQISDLPPKQGVAARAALGTLEANPRGFRTDDLPDKPIRLQLGATVTLKGHVTDLLTRAPVAKARVVARPKGAPGGRSAQTLITDEEGAFEAQDLIPGAWELLPSKTGYLAAQPREETLAKDQEVFEVELRLDPGLPVGGTVVDAQGRPIAGARLTLTGKDRNGANVRRDARTAGDGRFHWTGLEAGDYSLRARHSDYRNASVPDLRGGEDRLQISMPPRPAR